MFKSLRWRLLGWYAGLLTLVVAGFGLVLYYQVRKARLDEIDAELQACARVLEGTLRGFVHVLDGSPPPRDNPAFEPPPREPPPGRPPPPRPGEPGRRPPPPFEPPWDGPPREGPSRDAPPREVRQHLASLQLPVQFAQRFGDQGHDLPFFVVWLRNGEQLKVSPLPEGVTPPERMSLSDLAPERPVARQRGSVRELIVLAPASSQVLVGRSIGRELTQLRWLGWQLLMTGVGVLVVGLAGGWWLSNRAVRPIQAMSATAAGISASNLSERIALEGIDSELAGLADILNGMFGRLEAAFERQTRFTADASHELRTPLAIIQSHAELALSRTRSPEEYQATLNACVRASRRMKAIVEGLLTLARADAGMLEMKPQPLDLGALVKETVTLLAPLADQKGVTLAFGARPLEILADSTRLSQVVTNLVTNAISYNHPDGKVTVTVTADGKDAVLSVADTGCGIPEEDHPHLFERFYRADKARSREQGGCGLGLAICKSIVEALSGSIAFTSELNKGTTFVVRLPLKATGEPSSSDGGEGRPAMNGGSPETQKAP